MLLNLWLTSCHYSNTEISIALLSHLTQEWNFFCTIIITSSIINSVFSLFSFSRLVTKTCCCPSKLWTGTFWSWDSCILGVDKLWLESCLSPSSFFSFYYMCTRLDGSMPKVKQSRQAGLQPRDLVWGVSLKFTVPSFTLDSVSFPNIWFTHAIYFLDMEHWIWSNFHW